MVTCILLSISFLTTFSIPKINEDGHLYIYVFLTTFYNPRISEDGHLYIAVYPLSHYVF